MPLYVYVLILEREVDTSALLKIDLHFLCLTRHTHIHTQVTKQFPYLVLRGKHVAGVFYVCKWKADGLMAQRVGWETAGDSS